MVELAFLGRVLALGDATKLNLSLLPGGLCRPDTMQADGEASRPAGRAILDEVATLARGENAKAEAGQLVVPDEVVLFTDVGGVHYALGQFCHVASPLLERDCFRGSTTEAAG